MKSHPKQYLWSLFCALGMSALLCVLPAQGAKVSERTRQKREVEAERAELQKKLSALKRGITQTETARGHAADALAESEAAISQANRALHDLEADQRAAESRLARLSQEQDRLSAVIKDQQKRLSKLLHGQYLAGNEDRIRLLLSGDNPNRINRDLQYMGYVSQAQAKMIAELRVNMASVETNRNAAREAKEELDEIALEQQEQKALLEKEKAQRALLLTQLSRKLTIQRKEIGTFERDDQRLAALVDKLGRLIEEQRKAEAARQEQRRKEQLAREREKSEAAAAARMRSVKTARPNPDAIESDEPPPKSLGRNELTPERTIQDDGPQQAFGKLRGQLRLPVRGEVVARYGNKRGDGPAWKGLFIKTSEGAAVKAVASGQVVFADWLRGFGNLIIVDHGSEYMTIYGNNQSVLKHVGDKVTTGDTIASAGNSGGNEQSGLYFEMRHQGRAIDPLGWITTR